MTVSFQIRFAHYSIAIWENKPLRENSGRAEICCDRLGRLPERQNGNATLSNEALFLIFALTVIILSLFIKL
jgi:hypothetical protein